MQINAPAKFLGSQAEIFADAKFLHHASFYLCKLLSTFAKPAPLEFLHQ
jgi:hypothetical protein